ncbi:hypothetical protein N657DRAFT_651619 [Parathielavia appendiculata]|uniref:Uncharacterized protein n=1 Tax=Parathielavia appendiculata TaxID=2587402 RepID=A0AAN6YZ72_9PEZI|nr:hypothetical protein N657DRAFT_651619 [Parathielavia appendiculata]
MACLGVGTVGLVLNIALFALLLILDPNRITLTEGEQYWRKQTATLFGCLLNLLLAGAGVGLAIALGIRARDVGAMRLISPLIWASIQVYVEFPSSFPVQLSRKHWHACCCEVGNLNTNRLTRPICRALAVSTAIFDAVKNYREGLDLLD